MWGRAWYGQIVIIYMLCFLFSCTSSQHSLFASRTAHELYEDKLTNAGLRQTALGIQWFAAADKGVRAPLTVSLPYKETGYFAADRPNAAGYVFTCRRGEKLIISLLQKPAAGLKIFIDLWQFNSNKLVKHLQSSDTVNNNFSRDIELDGSYLLRLQPELLGSGEYTLTLTTAPTLSFPVPASAKPNIGSVWGDSRDEGARRHEGIDIFAPFRTPVLAAADGYVTNVNENKLGGKAVFMRPAGKDYLLYYAHLDLQIAREGQEVKKGDTLGLMGNTGNARTTPTHLHFGVYTNSGAINPLPFVETARQIPYSITAATGAINNYAHNTKAAAVYTSPTKSAVKKNVAAFTLLHVDAAAANWYRVSMADSSEGFISSDNISTISYRKLSLMEGKPIYDKPDTTAAVKLHAAANSSAGVLGSYNNFYFVRYGDDVAGWIKL